MTGNTIIKIMASNQRFSSFTSLFNTIDLLIPYNLFILHLFKVLIAIIVPMSISKFVTELNY